MNIAPKLYFLRIKRLLPCNAEQKKRYLAEMEHSVILYVQEKPDASFAELCGTFGSPEVIAKECIEQMNPKIFSERIVHRQWMTFLVLLAAAATTIIMAVAYWTINNRMDVVESGFFYDTVEVLPQSAEDMQSAVEEY